ncbi:MAG: polysaccharide deacetylase family protein [Solirubrobacterales bacterium]
MILLSLIFSLCIKKDLGVFSETRLIPIYSVNTLEKKISITFDVNWGEDNTEKILEILDKYNVKATFFLVGAWIDNYPDKVKLIYSKGHELGNHSDKHPDLTTISKERIVQEIAAADAKIMNLTGVKAELFRCPSGAYNNLAIETIKSTGHYAVQWDADSIDWKEQGADLEFNRIIKKAAPGSILLFHNNAKYTPENLIRILEYYKNNGYTFVKAGDLIFKENYYINSNGRQFEKN